MKGGKSRSSVHPPQYASFLKDYLVKNEPEDEAEPNQSFLSQDTVNKWPYPYLLDSDESKIYEEIINKFNNHNKFGIGKTFTTEEPGAMGAYSFVGDMEDPQSKDDYSYFSFPPSNTESSKLDPATIVHEVVHANDHQIDHLSPKIWKDLYTLYQNNPGGFDDSINKLRNKIDYQVFGFSNSYEPNTVKQTMKDEINQYKKELPTGNWNSTEYKKSKIKFKPQIYDWENSLSEMQKLVNLRNTRQDSKDNEYTIPNYHFKGTFASEFPAFMATNLTNPWKTDKNGGTKKKPILSLNRNEQEFLHSTLGHMSNAYPGDEDKYPTINKFINERRNSIEGTDTWKAGLTSNIEPNQSQSSFSPFSNTLPLSGFGNPSGQFGSNSFMTQGNKPFGNQSGQSFFNSGSNDTIRYQQPGFGNSVPSLRKIGSNLMNNLSSNNNLSQRRQKHSKSLFNNTFTQSSQPILNQSQNQLIQNNPNNQQNTKDQNDFRGKKRNRQKK